MVTHNSPVLQGVRRCRAPLYVIACAFVSLNCFQDLQEPVAPSWDVALTLPLINRSHSLTDIVEKDTGMLRVGVGGLIMYTTSLAAPPRNN